jgi:hypothetical protein
MNLLTRKKLSGKETQGSLYIILSTTQKKVFEVNHYLYNLHFRFFSSSETKKWKIAGKVPPKKKNTKKHDKN